jgi:hypothetical protein
MEVEEFGVVWFQVYFVFSAIASFQVSGFRFQVEFIAKL